MRGLRELRLNLLVTASAVAVGWTAAAAEGAAVLKVKVKKDGERCRRTVVKMDADPFCARAHEGKVGSEECIMQKTGELMNAVVFVKDGLGDAKFETPSEPAMLDQHGCMYSPHVQSVMVDQIITVKNSDDTLHNIHSFAEKQRGFNFAQPKKDMTQDVSFKRPEFVKIKCDVHPWMSAFVAVFEHPFHAVSDKDGACELKDLPAGELTIGVWHEEFGEIEHKITLADGETKEIELTYPNQEG